jgi:uncharacterized SAM-binding protein YcdF (DUF218 family)
MVWKIGLHRRHEAKSRTWGSKSRSAIVLLLGLAVVGWIGYKQLRAYFDDPDALLVLGGAVEREEFAAEFARRHPELEIWISGGSNPEYAEWIFAEAGIDLNRLHLDYRAVDTVTNFTTLVDEFNARGIDRVYLITSDDHMRRAKAIAEIVLGSRGITYKALPVTSGRSPEPLQKAIRDGARAILWVTTGYTGASFGQPKLPESQEEN